MVSVPVAVANVVPAELRSVIVMVAVPGLSARICHGTFVVAPAAIVAIDCVELVGLERRSALDGVKLITTEAPVTLDPPPLVTVAVAVNDWPWRMVAGRLPNVIAMPVGAGLAGVKLRAAEKLPVTPDESLARTRQKC